MLTKNIKEITAPNAFGNIKEWNGASNKIKGVAIMGRRESANQRIYSDRAIDDISRLSEGAKAFIDHPSKAEIKETGGVRPVGSWLGVFSNPFRQGNSVKADLTIQKKHHDLMESIITLAPSGLGFSINARVGVLNKNGTEVVESVKRLYSADLVTEAALCKSLFESALNGGNSDVLEFVKAAKGDGAIDLQAYDEFIRKIKEGNKPEGLVHMPGYQDLKETTQCKELTRQEIKAGLKEFFDIDIDDTKKLTGKKIRTVDDFIDAIRN